MVNKSMSSEELEEKIDSFSTIGEALEFLRYLEAGGSPGGFGLGSVTTIEAHIGNGSTLCGVAMAYEQYLQGYRVYSNLNLKFPSYPLTKLDFNRAAGVVILVDDAPFYIGAGDPNSKTARLWAFLLSQARKIGLRAYLTTQDVRMLDKRVIRTADVRVRVQRLSGDDYLALLRDWIGGTSRAWPISGKRIYPLYDTCQIIWPFQKVKAKRRTR